jgi:diguanylate cyclase (GGDEF)-like protein
VALFILSAVIPLALCAAILFRGFDAELTHAQQRSLDELVRSFGMTLLGRLGNADDVLRAIVSAPRTTDSSVEDTVAKLAWVSTTIRVDPREPAGKTRRRVPSPDGKQRQALKAGQPAMVWGRGPNGSFHVSIVRTLQSGAWLYAEISSEWLWADAGEYAEDTRLLLLDDEGKEIAAAGPALPGGVHAAGYISRSWEVFLKSRFSSPSWRLVVICPIASIVTKDNNAYFYLCGLIVITILLIALLSASVIRRQLRPLHRLTQATERLARREFDVFRDLAWNDEFGDLARAFDAMSVKLKTQFSALEALSHVDRLLLHAPEFEVILDTLLPRIAEVLGSNCASVILFDGDSTEHACAYDFYPGESERPVVRRITGDVSSLMAVCNNLRAPSANTVATVQSPCFSQLAPKGAITVRLEQVRDARGCAGVLCVGYLSEEIDMQDSGIGIKDLADRLSLILANLQQAARLEHQANYDSLTGLQNRHLFSERVRDAVAAARQRQGLGSLLYLDLDHFKRVNDTAGHTAGDELLRIVGERLIECVGEVGCVGRLGGDEFAVLLPSIAEPGGVRQIAERIITSLQQVIAVEGREHHVSASIGITVFPNDGTKIDELLKVGDIAMYEAKASGRGCAVFFQAHMQQDLLARLKMETDISRAVERREFTLHYQPIVSEAAGSISVEALVRWPGEHQGQEGWVSPGVFVPLAEEMGIIVELGDWILRQACAQFVEWRIQGVGIDYVSVNVSVRQLKESDYLETLVAALQSSGMQACELQIEITESVFAEGTNIEKTLVAIAELGVRVALDDFGTGYSSLSYLRTYPIHSVKIDRSFVKGLPDDLAACRLAESIIAMCAALDKRVIAEGVETEAQRQFLRHAGCATLQGYLLGRPMDPADIPGFAKRLRALSSEAEAANTVDVLNAAGNF